MQQVEAGGELRHRQFERKIVAPVARWAIRGWAWLARRPRLYQALTAVTIGLLGRLGRRSGGFRRLPLAGGWTSVRDLPAPQGETFQRAYARRRGGPGA